MKRLLTQFDRQRRQATVATPTCCCCCCCVMSIVSLTAATMLNARDLADRRESPGLTRSLYMLAALLVLPVSIIVGGAAVAFLPGSSGPGLAVGILFPWAVLLVVLYRRLGLVGCSRVVAVTVLVGSALIVAEAVAVLLLLLADVNGIVGPVYLIVAVVLSFWFVPRLRRLMGVPAAAARHSPLAARPALAAQPALPPNQLEAELEAARQRAQSRADRRSS